MKKDEIHLDFIFFLCPAPGPTSDSAALADDSRGSVSAAKFWKSSLLPE
jgi:hypothetical protein